MIAVKKNKIIFLATAVAMVFLALVFKNIEDQVGMVRYDQIYYEPSEEELEKKAGKKPESDGLVSHLPIISIDTKGQEIPGDAFVTEEGSITGVSKTDQGQDRILASVKSWDKEGKWHNDTQNPDYEGNITIHIRGNSSRAFTKKSYRIEMLSDKAEVKDVSLAEPTKVSDLDTKKVSLAGMNKGKSYILNGPFLDKTLIRNYMWMNISGQLLKYTPQVRFCELTINGEYQGLYVLMEPVDVEEERMKLSAYTTGDPVLSYVIHLEPKTESEKAIEEFTFYTRRLEEKERYEIAYPTQKDLSQQVKDYIVADFSEIEQAIYSYEAGSDDEFYLNYIDEDSFVDYYILMEFVGNNDCFQASTYFYKDARGKLHIGPVWDFNNCLDNFYNELSFHEFYVSQRGWYSQLMKSERFVNKVLKRYRELREGVLSDEYLTTYIQDAQDFVGSAADRNFEVWGWSFDYKKLAVTEMRQPDPDGISTYEEVNPSSYEEATSKMLTFMQHRGKWLDENINSLLQYCHQSRNANTALY